MAFKKGQSGNPGGRPAILQNVRELARAKTTDAVDALLKALTNPGERVQAATVLLAYGYGRPAQNVNIRRITSVEDLDEEELVALAGGEGKAADTRH